MKKQFVIHPGTIVFEEGHININDGRSWRTKVFKISVSLLIILMGAFYQTEFIMSKNPKAVSLVIIGIVLVVAGITIIIGQLRSSSKKKLDIHEIEKVVIREKRFTYLVADFILIKGPRRRVILDINDTLQFAKLSLEDLKQALNNKNIILEVDKSVITGTNS
jgi:hypothetical protein